MKMSKLSMVAIAAISIVSTTNADSFKDAFANGKVSGALQAYNFSKQVDSGTDWDITTLGFDLSYETAKFYGFGLKSTFQATYSVSPSDEDKDAKYWDMYGSGGQLSEIHLSYKMDNTVAKIGRMYFWSPVLGGSDSRVTKEAVQGATLVNTDIPDTTVTLAFVNKIQARTEVDAGWTRKTDGTDGDIGEFKEQTTGFISKAFNDGAYTVALQNKSVEDLKLTAAYLDVIDVVTTAYAEVSYKFDNYGLSTQYYQSEQEDEDSSSLIGVQATATFSSLDLLAAYVTVEDSEDVIPGLGNGADMAYTWSEEFADQYERDQVSYKLRAQYNINKNAYVASSYVHENNKFDDIENGYTAIIVSYKFTGDLEGLNIYAAHEMGSIDAKDKASRVKLNYNF